MDHGLDLLDGLPEENERHPRKKRHTGRNVLLALVAIFVVIAAVAGIFVFNLAHSFDSKSQKIAQAFPSEVLRPAKATTGAAATAQNILLLGSDSRGDSVDMASGGSASNQRSDTMMLVHVPADRKNVYIMSIMRDTWVDIPGHGQAKINAAMAFGGIPLTVQTLEGMFGTRIDHVAVVDFEGFKAITDAVGGVPVNSPQAFTTGKFSYSKGVQTLNGDEALAFVRERHAFADGDYTRVKDQQLFLKSVISKVLTPSVLANPLKISDVVNTVSPFISVDKSLDAAAMGSLALELRNIRPSNVESFTLPTKGTGTSADGQSIVIKDDEAISGISKALKTDQLGSFLQVSNLVK
ncbi:LCP family protein [Paenarthrobacter sp. Z7-10]|uniref:LCP family protein n=1 Tax=Paenarthrobacter sp. Z7-10 TaxID=2787635 RepID=UPI0022A93951|nr:LCP family protein [Paenarthrobacter sp. Z7-10]